MTQYVILALMAVAAAIVLARASGQSGAAALQTTLRLAVGIVVTGLALMLAFLGRMMFAIPLGAMGLALLLRGGGGPLMPGQGTAGAGGPGHHSNVRTAWLEMDLDHETGAMTGKVLDGDLAGRRLESLSEAEAIDVLRTVAGDPQSVQLMEAFMERRFPGWHDRAGDSAESRGGPMSREEALEILGLKPGASEEEIRTAHRRLMKRNHPDQGGSTWFATQINTAKDVLLG